jgi:hypothetical protein
MIAFTLVALSIMVNVTKKNFLDKSQDCISRLPSAAYAAIDLEMTGISLPSATGRPSKEHTPAERYALNKAVPERYAIIQAGVALFHENPAYRRWMDGAKAASSIDMPAEFHVRKYNFYLFSPPSHNDAHTREVVLNPGTVQFLTSHNMDYNRWLKEGVPYVTVDRAEELLERFKERHERLEEERREQTNGGGGGATFGSPGGQTPRKKNRVQLNRAEDIAFQARTMASLREWLDSAIRPAPRAAGAADDVNDDEDEVAARERREKEEGKSLLLPPCNAFLRRALYESIGEEYPSLLLEKADGNRIRVLRLNDEEKAEREECLKHEEWNALHRDHIGFTDVFRALSAACRGQLAMGENGHVRIDGPPDAEPLLSRFSDQAGSLRHFSYAKAKKAEAAARMAGVDKSPARKKKKKAKSKAIEDDAVILKGGEARAVPIIVHNGLMDLLFLLTHCHSQKLPENYGDAKRLIHEYFPNVYDTKILSTECSDGTVRVGNTALGELYSRVCLLESMNDHDSDEDNDAPIRYEVVGESTEDSNDDQMHEAAYDAFMTGAVFQELSRRIMRTMSYKNSLGAPSVPSAGYGSLDFLIDTSSSKSDGSLCPSRRFFGRNRIYLMQTLYTIDLEKDGDADNFHKGMLAEASFRVSGIEGSIRNNDIYYRMRGALKNANLSASFDITWIDDNTFIISTRAPQDGCAIFGCATEADLYEKVRHDGKIVGDAVRMAFSDATVEPFDEYLRSKAEWLEDEAGGTNGKKSGGIVRRTFGKIKGSAYGLAGSIFGSKRSRDDEESASGGNGKRRRLA